MRILIVDDEALIRALLVALFEDEGDTVVAARHGAEALELLDREEPDVIVLDLTMPILDGPGFYREMGVRGVDIPVVIVSAFGATSAARELGAAAAIAKPFDLQEIVDVVHGVRRTA